MFFYLIIGLTIGYFAGSLHGSLVANQLSGKNVKQLGTNNAGASNAFIQLGKKYGVLVAVIDIAKGAIALLIVHLIMQNSATHLPEKTQFFILVVTGAAAVIGHNYPIWMRFEGGKGTATMIGMLLMLDWTWGSFALFTFLLVTWLTDYIVIGGIMLYLMLIIQAFAEHSTASAVVGILLFIIMAIKHRENFERISNGTEKKVSESLKGKKA